MLASQNRTGQQKVCTCHVQGARFLAKDGDQLTTLQRNDRFNLKPNTLHDLQESLYSWQVYNFGEQDSERVLLGMCEESGELCHAQLKLEQGIRGTAEKHEADMRDAVGDICIYMLNYLSMMGEKIPMFVPREDVEKSEDVVLIRKSVISVYRLVGKITEDPESLSRVKHLIVGLLYLCALKGWDLEGVIRETWAEIAPRDWKSFPETGFSTQNTAAPQQAEQPQPVA